MCFSRDDVTVEHGNGTQHEVTTLVVVVVVKFASYASAL